MSCGVGTNRLFGRDASEASDGSDSVAAPAPAPAPVAAPAPAPAPVAVAPAEANGSTDGVEKGQITYDVKKAFGAIARIHKQSDAMTPKQVARLEQLTARYVGKTGKSKAHTQEYRPVHADPRVVTGFKPRIKEIIYPIVANRSEGCRLWDLDGNEYVDALNGFGMSLFGWAPDFVRRALQQQIEAEAAAVSGMSDPEIEAVEVKPKRGNVDVRLIALAWVPQSMRSDTGSRSQEAPIDSRSQTAVSTPSTRRPSPRG